MNKINLIKRGNFKYNAEKQNHNESQKDWVNNENGKFYLR